jgi:hypothetical protein
MVGFEPLRRAAYRLQKMFIRVYPRTNADVSWDFARAVPGSGKLGVLLWLPQTSFPPFSLWIFGPCAAVRGQVCMSEL